MCRQGRARGPAGVAGRTTAAAGFAHVLGAAAGAFVVVGVVAFVVEATGDDPTAPGRRARPWRSRSVALVLGLRAPGPIRAACVTAIVLAVPLVWFFAFFGGGERSRARSAAVYLLSLGELPRPLLPRVDEGRAILLAGVLVFFASWVTFEVGERQHERRALPGRDLAARASSHGFGAAEIVVLVRHRRHHRRSPPRALVIGLVFLGVGAALDRRELAGMATPFVAVGAVETLAGRSRSAGTRACSLGGLLAVVAGAVVGSSAATAIDDAPPRGSACSRCSAVAWRCIADIAPSSAAGVGGIAFGFALVLGRPRLVARAGARRARRR